MSEVQKATRIQRRLVLRTSSLDGSITKTAFLQRNIQEMPSMSTMSSATSNQVYAVCPQNGLSMFVPPSSFFSASHPISVTGSQSVPVLGPAMASAVPTPEMTYWMPHNCFQQAASTASVGGPLMASYNFVPFYSPLAAEPLTSAYVPHMATTAQIQVFNPLMNSTNMEVVWHETFDRLFRQFSLYRHEWYLSPTDEKPADNQGFHVFNDSAKVRFLCKECRNAWTSMKGRIVFWYRLNTESKKGEVLFKLFGQQCQKCMPGTFEHSMWYPEEVIKVITNVYNSVGQKLYGFQPSPIHLLRRPGKPRTQHNSQLCQACADRICTESGRQGNAPNTAA